MECGKVDMGSVGNVFEYMQTLKQRPASTVPLSRIVLNGYESVRLAERMANQNIMDANKRYDSLTPHKS